MNYYDPSYYYQQVYAPYYRDTTFAQPQHQLAPSGAFITPQGQTMAPAPAVEESYIENILRLNRGKIGTFYMTYENNSQWNAKIFRGYIEAAGRDHIIVSNPTNNERYLLLMLNLDYVTFDEPINYEYPFHGEVITPASPL